MDILEVHTHQDFRFADAVSSAVIRERGIEETFTFDNHFAAMRPRMIPGSGGRTNSHTA